MAGFTREAEIDPEDEEEKLRKEKIYTNDRIVPSVSGITPVGPDSSPDTSTTQPSNGNAATLITSSDQSTTTRQPYDRQMRVVIIAACTIALLFIGIVLINESRGDVVGQPKPSPQSSTPVAVAGLGTSVPGIAATLAPTQEQAAATTSAAPTTVATTASTAATTVVTPTVALPTPNAPIAGLYGEAIRAYQGKQWQQAANLFEQVQAQDTNYLQAEDRQRFAESLENLAQQLIDEAAQKPDFIAANIKEAEDKLTRALGIAPDRTQARALLDRIQQYRSAIANSSNREIAIAFEKMDIPTNNFLDGRQLLYKAYINYGNEQKQQANAEKDLAKKKGYFEEAQRIWTKAVGLQGVDISEAQNLLAAVATDIKQAQDAIRAQIPTPKPTAVLPSKRTFAAKLSRNYSTDASTGANSSCVGGRVTDNRGRAVGGAVIEANNGRGVRASATSGNDGLYKICGLGSDKWSAVLFYVPGSRPLANQPYVTFMVSGASWQVAEVNFRER